jgi:molybdopterin-guanine dinucleotide biosynthesis protein A
MSTADSALILGGGKSTRMGFDKKNLELNGNNVLVSLITKLRSIFSEVLLSSNESVYEKIITLHDELGSGPLAGIYQGLKHCKSEYLYVTACDMPFISISYIHYIREIVMTRQVDACVARYNDGRYELFNCFYNKSCLPYIYDALTHNEFRPRMVLDKVNCHTVEPSIFERFNENGNMFCNINTKEDLELLQGTSVTDTDVTGQTAQGVEGGMEYQPPQSLQQMILIGSMGRNSGKTTMALELIRLWKDHFPITAVKITSVNKENKHCPRNINCGGCRDFSGESLLEEIKEPFGDKDTDKFIRAGAHKVFWLRSTRIALQKAFAAFSTKVPEDSLIICESNCLARAFRPACFIMLSHSKDHPGKPSAQGLIEKADIVLQGSYEVSDITRTAEQIKIGRTEKGRPLVHLSE